ncbi:MAG: hypothetical protein ACFFCS_20045 [Candidatus Hodarchaeota archaeon]
MTKSSRRKDKALGRPEYIPCDLTCEECKGKLVKTGKHSYICTVCGLIQARYDKEHDYNF